MVGIFLAANRYSAGPAPEQVRFGKIRSKWPNLFRSKWPNLLHFPGRFTYTEAARDPDSSQNIRPDNGLTRFLQKD